MVNEPTDTPTEPVVENSGKDDKPPVEPKQKAFINKWASKIKAARKFHDTAFKRMDRCMQLAKDGAEKEWLKDEKFVVPIINRHINQSVSQLYAKNPKAFAKRKPRRMFKVWDGQMASLSEAGEALKQAAATGMPPDPNYVAIIQDAEQVKQYDVMMDGLADTLTILHNHYIQDQASQYKQQFKSAVRRTKVTGVAYAKLGFRRALEKDPDVTAQINETSEQIAVAKRILEERAEDEIDDDSADMEQLRTLLADLQSKETLIVSEGPVWSFPKSRALIVDPKCQHLKTLVGADWVAEEYELTPDDIDETYGVDVSGSYTEYKQIDDDSRPRWSDKDGDVARQAPGKVWEVWNRKTGQVFTICDGHDEYLKPPAEPDVRVRRFFVHFPLVFNETESDDEADGLFPPSDVWQARHVQSEYNRCREGLREHRQQNRPAYVTGTGALEKPDKELLANHASGAIIELTQLAPGEKVADKIQALPSIPIDPKLYEVESLFSDMLRVVGSQQANLGPTTDSTATESSIAEQSRTVSLADNVDDIDDWLSGLTQATGEVMLRSLSKSTVMEIVGPGAVWPDLPQTRDELVEEIILDVRAGSSGRPNQAAEIAKLERAMPILIQLPNVNPVPPAQKYLDLLDIDAEDMIIEGLPSIVAMNAAMNKPPPGGSLPEQQGGQGVNNEPTQPNGQTTSQPAYPTVAGDARHTESLTGILGSEISESSQAKTL